MHDNATKKPYTKSLSYLMHSLYNIKGIISLFVSCYTHDKTLALSSCCASYAENKYCRICLEILKIYGQ